MFSYGGELKMEFCTGYLCAETETGSAERYGFIVPRGSGAPTFVAYNNVGARNESPSIVERIWHEDHDDVDPSASYTGSHNATSSSTNEGDMVAGTGADAGLLEDNEVSSLVEADAWTDPTNFDLTIKNISSALYQAGTDRSLNKPDSRVDATIDIRGVTQSFDAVALVPTSLKRPGQH